jgi:site-specific recombinase XerD
MSKDVRLLELLVSFFMSWLPEVRGMSANTTRSYKYAFSMLFDYLYQKLGIKPDRVRFDTLTRDVLVGYLDWLERERGCKPQTRNQRLAALSSFARFAAGQGGMEVLGFCAAVNGIPNKRTDKGEMPSYFTLEEISLLLALPDTTTKIGYRDAVLLSVMYASGARAQEMCDLRVSDCHFGAQTVLTIIGKGRKIRQVVIQQTCAALLKDYIHRTLCDRTVAKDQPQHLFSSQTHEHMTISCIEARVTKYVKIAKERYPDQFKCKVYSPHSLRHSIAIHMLEAEIPLPVIKVFLGHASIESTLIYATVSPALAAKFLKEKSSLLDVKITEWKKPLIDTLPFLLKFSEQP